MCRVMWFKNYVCFNVFHWIIFPSRRSLYSISYFSKNNFCVEWTTFCCVGLICIFAADLVSQIMKFLASFLLCHKRIVRYGTLFGVEFLKIGRFLCCFIKTCISMCFVQKCLFSESTSEILWIRNSVWHWLNHFTKFYILEVLFVCSCVSRHEKLFNIICSLFF